MATNSFALSLNNMYFGLVSNSPPESVDDFVTLLNPVTNISVKNNRNELSRDINGRLHNRELTSNIPKSITINFDYTAITAADLYLLEVYQIQNTNLWLIDGAAEVFKYNNTAEQFSLGDIYKDEYSYPYIVAWNGYIADIAGDLYSGAKMSGSGQITFAVSSCYPTAYTYTWQYWKKDGGCFYE